MRTTRTTHRTLAATALLGTLLVGGCGNIDGGDDDGGDAAERTAVTDGGPAVPGPPEDFDGGRQEMGEPESAVDGALMETSDDLGFEAQDAPAKPESAPQTIGDPAVISKAMVSVHADDVGKARLAAMKVMGKYGGSLQADETSSGDDGQLEAALLILRIPSKDYSRAKAELEQIADFVESHSGSEDVTTEVIDVAARIRAQEQSLARIEALLVQATNLRQVIAIESQLARRQADLDSLKSRQAWLEDQTSEATITLHIERTPEEEVEKDEDDKGFLAGLSDGWDNLVSATIGIVTVVGLLLPFAIVLALIAVPTLALVRRLRPELARQPAVDPAE